MDKIHCKLIPFHNIHFNSQQIHFISMLNIFFLSLSRSLPCPIVFKSGALWLCALWMAIANSWAQRSSSHVTVKIFNKTDFVGLIGILTGWATHYSRYKACLYSRGGWFYVGKTLYWFSLSCSSFSHDSHINCHGGHPIAFALAFGHGINFNFQMQFNCDTHYMFFQFIRYSLKRGCEIKSRETARTCSLSACAEFILRNEYSVYTRFLLRWKVHSKFRAGTKTKLIIIRLLEL